MSAAKAGALFVGLVVLLVGAAAVVPFVGGAGGTEYSPVENENFQPDRIVAEESPEEGEITMESNAEGRRVLIDAAHGNEFSEAELAPLIQTLVENGHTVDYYRGRGGSLNESLRGADAYVVINPSQPFQDREAQGVEAFADAGGRVLMLGDPPSVQFSGGFLFASFEEVAYKQTGVASRFGVAFGSGYLYNVEENDANFKSVYATPTGEGALTDGVDRVVMRNAVPVATGSGSVAMVGTEGTTLSSTRRTGEYAVAVRNGDVAAIGDTSFLAREDVYEADNEVLLGNLADFLVSGDKEPGAPAEPGPDRPTRPPRPPGAGGSAGGSTTPAPAPTPAPASA